MKITNTVLQLLNQYLWGELMNNLLIMDQFNLLLETVDLDDEIGHRFVVDIEFDEKIATE